MDPKKTTLERAFEIAASGNTATVEEIRKKLKAEGYEANHIVGPSLLRQLRQLIANAKGKPGYVRRASWEKAIGKSG